MAGAPRYDSPYDIPPDDVDPNALPTQTFAGGSPMPLPGQSWQTVTTNDPAGVLQPVPTAIPRGDMDEVGAPMAIGGHVSAPSPPPMLARPTNDEADLALPPERAPAPPPAAVPPPKTAPKPKHAGGGGAPKAAAAPAVPPAPLLTDEELAARSDLRNAREEQAKAQQGVTKVAVDRAAEEATLAKQQTEAEATANAAAEKQRSEAKSYLMQQRDEVRKFHATDLFEGREAARVGAWVAAGIGQFASALGGGPNMALQVLNKATDDWAAKERARYERLVQKGEMAAHDMELAEVEIRNKMIGIRESFINRRTELLKRYEGPEAAAKGDLLTAGLAKENAKDDMAIGAATEKRVEDRRELAVKEQMAATQAVAARAGAAASYANAAHARAEARKTDAETKLLEAGGMMAGKGGAGGRAAGKMIDLALLSNQQRDDVETLQKTVNNDPKSVAALQKALIQVQDNETRLTADRETAKHTGGALLVNTLRDFDMAPRTMYRKVGANEQRLIRAADLLATKAAEALAHTEGEREKVKQQLMPAPNDPPEVIRDKLSNLLSQTGATTALAGQYANVASQGAAAQRQALPGFEGGGAAPTLSRADYSRMHEEFKTMPPGPARDRRLQALRNARVQFTGAGQ